MRWKRIIFDFDGTLFDTGDGIVHGVRLALERYGFPAGSDKELHKYIGPPLIPAFMQFCGMTEEQARAVKEVYRAYYTEKGVFECKPIEGAEKCLQTLRAAGCTLAIATCKPLHFARQILERYGFVKYFSAICGAEADAHAEKAEILSEALSEIGFPDGESCVMIGDRKYDILGAKTCGIPCIALDTGFAEEGEYQKAGALCIVKNYEELTKLLFSEN